MSEARLPNLWAILGIAGIVEAYKTGRGSIVIRGKVAIEDISASGRQRLVITEIPYQVNKAKLIERVAELVRDKKIEGISDIRDESAQEDIRSLSSLKRARWRKLFLTTYTSRPHCKVRLA